MFCKQWSELQHDKHINLRATDSQKLFQTSTISENLEQFEICLIIFIIFESINLNEIYSLKIYELEFNTDFFPDRGKNDC